MTAQLVYGRNGDFLYGRAGRKSSLSKHETVDDVYSELTKMFS